MKTTCWNVYFHGRIIDTIWYDEICDADYVRNSLINHDGYDVRIKVRKAR